MSKEVELSFLNVSELLTKPVYDINNNGVVDLSESVQGGTAAPNNTFYGKVGGNLGFHPATVTSIGNIGDVNLAGVGVGYILQYNGTGFVTVPMESVFPNAVEGQVIISRDGNSYVSDSLTLSDIGDVNTTGIASNTYLKYDGSGYVFDTISLTTSLVGLDDTNISNPINGQILQYNGTNWTNVTVEFGGGGTAPTSLNDLTDVNTSGQTNGSILQYNGTSYVPANYDLSKLALINPAGASQGQALMWNGFASAFVPTNLPTQKENLNDLNDVTISGASVGQVLTFNGTGWNNQTPPAMPDVPESINDLSDVNITSPSNDQVLAYDTATSSFINKTISTGGTGGATSLGELTDVDGTVVPSNGHVLTYNASKSQYEPQVLPTLPGGGGITVEYARVMFNGDGTIKTIQHSPNLEIEITDPSTEQCRWHMSTGAYKYPPMASHAYSFKGAEAIWDATNGFRGGNYQYLPLTTDLLSGSLGNRDATTAYTRGNIFGSFDVPATSDPTKRRFFVRMMTPVMNMFAEGVTAFTGDEDKYPDIWIMYVFGG